MLENMSEDSRDKQYLKDAAEAVHALLPDHHGLIILAVPYKGGERRIKYISNLKREDAVKVLKEFLLTACDEDTWLKHVP